MLSFERLASGNVVWIVHPLPSYMSTTTVVLRHWQLSSFHYQYGSLILKLKSTQLNCHKWNCFNFYHHNLNLMIWQAQRPLRTGVWLWAIQCLNTMPSSIGNGVHFLYRSLCLIFVPQHDCLEPLLDFLCQHRHRGHVSCATVEEILQ